MNIAEPGADPFAFAADIYDASFSSLPRVIALREQIHRQFDRFVRPGGKVLELGCGTGEDACRMAARGFRIIATDPSASMLAVARKKAARLGVPPEFRQLRAEETSSFGREKFDAVFSNFGSLNCIESLGSLFHSIAIVLRPGGIVVSVFLNRTHLWETAAYIARGDPRRAFRRWTDDPVDVQISGSICRTWYHTVATIASAAREEFSVEKICGLNVFSPPPSSEGFCLHHPDLIRTLDRFDGVAASLWPFNRWGDHVMFVCRKRF